MTNIRKVAKLAGVSVATVSRTLKTPDVVSPGTRDKVLAAVEQADYRPNLTAVQFRSQRTRNLVVLVPIIANTFFASIPFGAGFYWVRPHPSSMPVILVIQHVRTFVMLQRQACLA